MANVLILGGGFAGVVAAENLARDLGAEHQITLISRSRRFIFYPALVRLAFGQCGVEDISYDLREAMLDRRVRFIEAEVAHVDAEARRVILARGEVAGEVPYDYLICALGRRLASERVTGFFEHAHHLLGVEAAIRFGAATREFHAGRALLGYCPGAHLTVPVYEAAHALSRALAERQERAQARITILSPEAQRDQPGGREMTRALRETLAAQDIELLPDFPISRITAQRVETNDGFGIAYDLLMLIPPFGGASAFARTGLTDEEGYIPVDRRMKVKGAERIYAAGDAVAFDGPKMGHMAVRQGEVAAANLAAEITGREPEALYEHEMMTIIDAGSDSIYFHQDLWDDTQGSVRQGRFWAWAKRAHEKYWQHKHG